jgi:hypothetical protein
MQKWVLVCLVAVATVTGSVRQSEAAPVTCFGDYARCNYRAAREDDWFMRVAMGLDCSLGLFKCVREVAGV